jgi:hypothetical protein
MTTLIKCLYCEKEKLTKEFSLEHVIPQFLGGNQSPDIFKTDKVCGVCNNNLGLFVDAAFARSFLVNQHLTQSAYSFYDPAKKKGLPLICIGLLNGALPHANPDEVCELWLGPLGEQIFWVRPKDDRLYWYSGGNPRTAKEVESRAYYFFSERSKANIHLSLNSFKESFEGCKVIKILGTRLSNAEDTRAFLGLGFSTPSEIDMARIGWFVSEIDEVKSSQFSLYIKYDHRFMAKLALGVAYCLVGEGLLADEYTQLLRKALWYREGEGDFPEMQGTVALGSEDPDGFYKSIMGFPSGVVVSIHPNPEGIGLNLNINQSLNWTVLCCKKSVVPQSVLDSLGEGRVIVLFKQLGKGIDLRFVEFVSHKVGSWKNPDLLAVSNIMNERKDYFKNLS